jgi:transcriptional regulator with XRE-family HTH domain
LPFCTLTLTAKKPTKLPTILNTIGDHIKKRRLELGLYQTEVTQISGVTESTVTNWEKNRTNPTLHLLPKISAFLGYDPISTETKQLDQMLLRYRKSRGVTQKELAKKIGIDLTTLSRLERGQSTCFQTVLKKVNPFLNGRILSENCR